jgi:hypothetical protein
VGSSPASGFPVLTDLTLATFEPRLGESFRIALDEGQGVDVELVEAVASAGGGARGEGLREPFSIVFRGPYEPVLPQRIYRIEHDELGALEIFLVPIGPDESGMRYEAVFA